MKIFVLVTLALGAVSCGQLTENTNSSPSSKLPLAIATAQGKLITVMAIGGETTGYAVMNEKNQLVEVDFKNLKGLNVESLVNTDVQVDGRMEVRRGIERPSRNVLVATEARKTEIQMCDGLFEGALLNAFTLKCEEGSFSGCYSPYPYGNLAQCEQAARSLAIHL